MAALLTTAALVVSACGGSSGGGGGSHSSQAGGSSSSEGARTPHRGGSVVDLLDGNYSGAWPSGLDPAYNTTGGSNLAQQQALFGGLFLLKADEDGSNAHIVPNQAASGTMSADGKTLTIKLRPGMKFSDGTPLDAKAVMWNFDRDTTSTCTCAPKWQVRKKDPFTSPDSLTVMVHLTAPNAALVNSFPVSSVNWMVSPTALEKMGKKAFAVKPVGAGPFIVVSDTLSSKLVLKRNPNYFRKGLPYLDHLTFQSIGGDQAAYQALQAGQGQAYEDAELQPVIRQAKSNPKLKVTVQPGTSPYMVHFNTRIAPFNNKKAREAVYYATNWAAINKGLFDGESTVVQGFTTPADLFYHQKTPGYRTYNLAKAKQLVKELGGLSFQVDITDVYAAKEVTTALQTQWQKAGMHVTVKAWQLAGLIKRLKGGSWTAEMATAGAWDPAVGVGIGFRFQSTSPYTGVKDKKLDTLIADAAATTDGAKRDSLYQQVAKYISDNALCTFGFAIRPAQFAVDGLHAPGLTTQIPGINVRPGVIWGEAWLEQS
jgi:peptide/nickel transport system substrate-binding protein